MSQAFIIEIGQEAVGVVVRQHGDRAFHFHSATRAFHALDGRTFDTPLAAERAAQSHHAKISGKSLEQTNFKAVSETGGADTAEVAL